MPEMQAPPPQAQEEQGGGQEEALKGMIQSIDQGLGQLTQVIGQMSPEAAQGLEQVNQAFREVIESILGGGGGAQENEMASPETQGRKGVQPAF